MNPYGKRHIDWNHTRYFSWRSSADGGARPSLRDILESYCITSVWTVAVSLADVLSLSRQELADLRAIRRAVVSRGRRLLLVDVDQRVAKQIEASRNEPELSPCVSL